MRARQLSVVTIVAAFCGALVLAAVASAGDAASHRAGTQLTIQSWPKGFFGYVDSSHAKRCAKHRKVSIFKQRGARKNPKKDKRLGTTTAKRNQGGYQWSKKTGKTGKFYVKARKRDGCRAAFSKTERSVGTGDTIPSCPSTEAICKFDQMHVDITTYCPGFGNSDGDCSGSSTGGPSPWSPAFGYFVWEENKPGTSQRAVDYHATNGEDKNPRAELFGTTPGPGSADYSVDKAYAQASSLKDLTWYTPDIEGAKAGAPGGPLYLNFENGTIGADVYIRGYLYRR